MSNTKPYVQVATICENVLTEPDQVSSVIRIIDTLYLTLPEGADISTGEVGAVALKMFVVLKGWEHFR